MKTLIPLILLIISTSTVANGQSNYERVFGFPSLGQQQSQREQQKDQRMLNNMKRELRETGRIAPKDNLDIYNMREGYGYDGGHIDNFRHYR